MKELDGIRSLSVRFGPAGALDDGDASEEDKYFRLNKNTYKKTGLFMKLSTMRL